MKSVAVIVVVVGLLLVGIVAAGTVRSTSSSSESEEPAVVEGPMAEPPSDGSTGLVFGKHQASSGFSILGWQLSEPEYKVHIGFVPPEGCDPPESGTLVAEGACTNIPASGQVSGGGTTSQGDVLVVVEVRISEDCFTAVAPDDVWPSTRPACAR